MILLFLSYNGYDMIGIQKKSKVIYAWLQYIRAHAWHELNQSTTSLEPFPPSEIGLCRLCQHNFQHNRGWKA